MMRWWHALIIGIVIVGLAGIPAGCGDGQFEFESDQLSPWPMLGHDAQNTFCSPYEDPKSPSIRWVTHFDELEISYPLIGEDGTIYLGGLNINDDTTAIILVDAQGSWKKLTEMSGVAYVGALAPSGTLYVVLMEDQRSAILALDPEGKELWRTDIRGGFGGPIVGADGAIYANYYLGEPKGEEVVEWGVIAINPDGTHRWSVPGIPASWIPAMALDGTVYTCTEEGKVCAYNSRGEKRWEYDGRIDWPDYYDDAAYSLSVGPDGTVYITPWLEMWGVETVRILALTPRGTKKWHVDVSECEARVLFTGPIAPDGSFYPVLEREAVFKVSPSGSLSTFATGDFTSGVIDSAGTVYLASYDRHRIQVVAFHPDGSEKWSLDLSPFIESEIIVLSMGADGTIYAVTEENDLLAIGR